MMRGIEGRFEEWVWIRGNIVYGLPQDGSFPTKRDEESRTLSGFHPLLTIEERERLLGDKVIKMRRRAENNGTKRSKKDE